MTTLWWIADIVLLVLVIPVVLYLLHGVLSAARSIVPSVERIRRAAAAGSKDLDATALLLTTPAFAAATDWQEVAPGVRLRLIAVPLLQPLVGEADVAAVADDDVVEDADAHQFADLAEALRDRDVLGARRRVAARVVVHQNDGGGAFLDHRHEHLA